MIGKKEPRCSHCSAVEQQKREKDGCNRIVVQGVSSSGSTTNEATSTIGELIIGSARQTKFLKLNPIGIFLFV
jgi:hypothetical protein